MVAGWWRVHPEVNLVGRAGFVGDELGSALIGSRVVHDLMRLCFLLERQYAPYSKWFGTAFARLGCGSELSPVLWRAVRAPTWQEREHALNDAYAAVAAIHDASGITEPVPCCARSSTDRDREGIQASSGPGSPHDHGGGGGSAATSSTRERTPSLR
jgi:hypothetical protein